MEHSKAFQQLSSTITEIERRLSICEDSAKLYEKSAIAAEKEIEEHFARCLNALAARKEVLLKEIGCCVANQVKSIEDSKIKLGTTMTACKQTLAAGSLLYSSNKGTAETLWKEIAEIALPQVENETLSVNLPLTFIQGAPTHGTIISTTVETKPEGQAVVTDPEITISTLAGTGKSGFDDGIGRNASFNSPHCMCLNPYDDCLYVCDKFNSAIRKVSLKGEVSTFANGIKQPYNIAMNCNSKVFFVTSMNANIVYKVTLTGVVTIFAGSGASGRIDGVGTNATFTGPNGIAIDQESGNIFISDCHHLIRKISPQGNVSTLTGTDRGYVDGSAAKFNSPSGLYFDAPSSSLLVCDTRNNKLRRVLVNGNVTTLCEVPEPLCVTRASQNTFLVGSATNQIYSIIEEGHNNNTTFATRVFAGNGQQGIVDGKAHESSFNSPHSIVQHTQTQSFFISDDYGDSIRKITLAK